MNRRISICLTAKAQTFEEIYCFSAGRGKVKIPLLQRG